MKKWLYHNLNILVYNGIFIETLLFIVLYFMSKTIDSLGITWFAASSVINTLFIILLFWLKPKYYKITIGLLLIPPVILLIGFYMLSGITC